MPETSGVLGETHGYRETHNRVEQTVSNKAALRLSGKLDDLDESDSRVMQGLSSAARKYVLNADDPNPAIHVSNGELTRRLQTRQVFNDQEPMSAWHSDRRQFVVEHQVQSLGDFVDEYIGQADLYLEEDGKQSRKLADTADDVDWGRLMSYDWDQMDEQLMQGRVNPDEPVDGTYLNASDPLFAQVVAEADPRQFDSYGDMAETVDVHYNRAFTRPGGEYTDEDNNVYGDTDAEPIDAEPLGEDPVTVEA